MTTIFIVLCICFFVVPVDKESKRILFPLFAGNDLLPLSKVSERVHFRKVGFLARYASHNGLTADLRG
jgi:hypothetical protein